MSAIPSALAPRALPPDASSPGDIPSVVEIRLPRTLSAASVAALSTSVAEAPRSGRVLVLRGADGVFCDGLDLAEAGRGVAPAMKAFVEALLGLYRSPVPTLALADGSALGGGLGILAACDMAVATERSTFGLPEALHGLVPGAVFPLLLQRLPVQKARLLALQGLARDAAWAVAHGLIDEVVPPDRLEIAVQRCVRLLARARPRAVRALRELSSNVASTCLENAVRSGAEATLEALSDPLLAEELRAFAAGDAPPWGEP